MAYWVDIVWSNKWSLDFLLSFSLTIGLDQKIFPLPSVYAHLSIFLQMFRRC